MKTERETAGTRSKRKSVTLTARDLADIAMIRNSPEAQRVVGASGSMSEAALLHRLVAHSLQQAREAVEVAGYAALAADDDERAIESALRSTRRRASAE